jgi:hypothetical protein
VVAVVSFFSLCKDGFESMICTAVVDYPTASGLVESDGRTNAL